MFTAAPLIFRAILDKDVYYKVMDNKKSPIVICEKILVKKYYPFIYYVGQTNIIFTLKNFGFWIIQGIIHCFYIFYLNYIVFHLTIMNESGYNDDMWSFSITTFTCIILVNINLIFTKKKLLTYFLK